MIKMLLYGLLIYFLYKVIFEIVVPISKGVKSVRQNMEQMQKDAHFNQQQAQSTKPTMESKDAEYIDFEEVEKKSS